MCLQWLKAKDVYNYSDYKKLPCDVRIWQKDLFLNFGRAVQKLRTNNRSLKNTSKPSEEIVLFQKK